jgi:CheY-like chemotaxis protein
MIRASRDRLGQAGRGTALPPGLPTEGHLLLVGLSAALRAMRDLLDRFPLVSLPDEPAVLAHLQTGSRPNLLLLDLTSRSSGGWALLRGLASHPRWSRLPVAAVLPEDQLWTAVHLPVIKALPPGVSSAELRALVGFFVASALP